MDYIIIVKLELEIRIPKLGQCLVRGVDRFLERFHELLDFCLVQVEPSLADLHRSHRAFRRDAVVHSAGASQKVGQVADVDVLLDRQLHTFLLLFAFHFLSVLGEVVVDVGQIERGDQLVHAQLPVVRAGYELDLGRRVARQCGEDAFSDVVEEPRKTVNDAPF